MDILTRCIAGLVIPCFCNYSNYIEYVRCCALGTVLVRHSRARSRRDQCGCATSRCCVILVPRGLEPCNGWRGWWHNVAPAAKLREGVVEARHWQTQARSINVPFPPVGTACSMEEIVTNSEIGRETTRLLKQEWLNCYRNPVFGGTLKSHSSVRVTSVR